MANTLSIMNVLRSKVSKQRIRYTAHGYNLDLAYICDNIIAMGYPADNIECIYRNRFDDVYQFFEENHRDHYKIYNLCSERSYDVNKFHGRVACFPFDDHNPPTIELIKNFCDDVDLWLKKDKSNVAAVHCKAGKGRTGTMICCYLLHSGFAKTAEEALAYYDEKRTKDKKGVTIPSQRRYVNYYSKLLRCGKLYERKTLQICEIKFSAPLQLHSQGSVHCAIYSSQDSTQNEKVQLLQTFTIDFRKSQSIDILKELTGDVKILLYHTVMKRKDKYFHFWFNTFFVYEDAKCIDDGGEMKLVYELTKYEIDDAHKDKEHKNFPEDFKVQLILKPVPSRNHHNNTSSIPNSLTLTPTTTMVANENSQNNHNNLQMSAGQQQIYHNHHQQYQNHHHHHSNQQQFHQQHNLNHRNHHHDQHNNQLPNHMNAKDHQMALVFSNTTTVGNSPVSAAAASVRTSFVGPITTNDSILLPPKSSSSSSLSLPTTNSSGSSLTSQIFMAANSPQSVENQEQQQQQQQQNFNKNSILVDNSTVSARKHHSQNFYHHNNHHQQQQISPMKNHLTSRECCGDNGSVISNNHQQYSHHYNQRQQSQLYYENSNSNSKVQNNMSPSKIQNSHQDVIVCRTNSTANTTSSSSSSSSISSEASSSAVGEDWESANNDNSSPSSCLKIGRYRLLSENDFCENFITSTNDTDDTLTINNTNMSNSSINGTSNKDDEDKNDQNFLPGSLRNFNNSPKHLNDNINDDKHD